MKKLNLTNKQEELLIKSVNLQLKQLNSSIASIEMSKELDFESKNNLLKVMKEKKIELAELHNILLKNKDI